MNSLSKGDQAELTKSKLITIGRRYFTKYGFSQTASEDIVKAAQVTRGALYHHFDGKEGLFAAVLEKILQEAQTILERELRKEKDSFIQLRTFCHTYLKTVNHPEVLQISLIDAQTVIGRHRWSELTERYCFNILAEILEELIEARILKPYTVVSLTHLLAGAMHDIVLWSAGQKHPDIALAEASASLEEILLSLRLENWDTTEDT